MQDFEAIRPYQDEEVEGVVARLVRDANLIHGASVFLAPRLAGIWPAAADWLAARLLIHNTRKISSVGDVQSFLKDYMTRLINESIAELTVSGLDELDTDQAYLFISNHRDIMMDTGLLNYVIYQAGYQTARSAVGDNLLSEAYAADLMRLNKSFVIHRSVTGSRAVYAVLSRTSEYIRHSLECGHSIWIAHREGRSKDGFDRTEPALLKMLALAYRSEIDTVGDLLKNVKLIPVSISYELDPCDRRKAHELTVLARDGEYRKSKDEDLISIVEGMTGFKGRVHLHFSKPMTGEYKEADSLALAIDRAIIGGMRVFPTQAAAARELGYTSVPDAGSWLPEVESAYSERLAAAPASERAQLLAGYGNLIRNRNELGISISGEIL